MTRRKPRGGSVPTWTEYVREVIGDDTQTMVARKTGVDQTTISRWLSLREDTPPRLSSEGVRAFARGYHRPVLEAFVAARLLSPEEAGVEVQLPLDWSTVTDAQLVAELRRRLSR